MPQTRLSCLLHRYFEGTASGEEEKELMLLIADENNAAEVQAVMEQVWEKKQMHFPALITGERSDEMLRQIIAQRPGKKQVSYAYRKKWYVWTAAAVFCAVALLGAYLYKNSGTSKPVVAKANSTTTPNDAAPGGNKAKLVLSNGTEVVLNETGDGIINGESNCRVKKQNEQLVYAAGNTAAAVGYNTLCTPKGGQYSVVLPDGTRVWLNAASSLHYPTLFTGKERQVELKGAAYFEVATNQSMPFVVQVNDMHIQVLGTSFNVMAYSDEKNINTTLLNGAVKIAAGNETALLHPGQQASWNSHTAQIHVTAADTDQAMAWKNGQFYFKDASVEAVMRQLCRWYDVEVKYEGPVTEHKFVGRIWRSYTLSQALALLQASEVHFRIEGKLLIVNS